MMFALALITLLGTALAGDLWLDVQVGGPDSLTLDIPGNWLLDLPEPLEVRVDGTPVDLRALATEVDRKRVGTRRAIEGHDATGNPLSVRVSHHRKAHDKVLIATLGLEATGPEGGALNLEIPVTDASGRVSLQLAATGFQTLVSANGIEVPWGNAGFFQQLVRSAPRTLLSIQTSTGTVVTLRSE